jgi:monovalent cation:proton antiporter-2 (CPA2) family protein
MSDDVLTQAFIYLAAAVIAVPVAKRLGLGSVLGYLIAGVVIGPFGLGLLGEGGEDVMHFAEFGVVMMLFVVGLELEPNLLWRLRGPILGMGGLQVVGTAAVVTAGAMLVGLAWQPAVAVGLTLALSSTAIVLQSLQEKGLLRTAGGQSSFAVLLFQDIAVIPMLALFPLLATVPHSATGASEESHAAEATTWISGLPAWAQTLAVLAAVAGVVLSGRFLVRPALRAVAATRLRELFTAAALLLVIGIALLMTQVGLSPALGTFLAGVVLANSEYRHELEGDIEPFKGLLLGLFFIAVGASIDVALILAQPLLIVGLVLAIIAVKFAVLFAISRAFKLSLDQGLLLAFALPQVGEFGFVLFAFANQQGVLDTTITSPLVAAVALSMALTPLLLLVNERFVQPRFGTRERAAGEPDTIDDRSPVIIAGFGEFGATVGRLLRANGVRATVLDLDSDRVDLLRKLGMEVYYGDASRYDLLLSAGAEEAKLLVLALDSPERTVELVHTARTHFPHLQIMARAFEWNDAHDLLEAGVEHVYRQSLDTALRAGTEALRLLGARAYTAQRAAQKFLRHDEESLRQLTRSRAADRTSYLSAARQRIEDLERIMLADRAEPQLDRDAGWDPESLREEVRRLGLAGPPPERPSPSGAAPAPGD